MSVNTACKCGRVHSAKTDCPFCGVYATKSTPKRLPCDKCGYFKPVGEACKICELKSKGMF